ncbi:MAG TPA: molybdenum ABC transporter ATP-binding protein, partial [Armatimonadetes bacterium]|nr:molybdenum ABC transporter ATP-binding protein [Armatimonadota bacterium]
GPKAEALTAPRMSQTFGAPIRVECRDGWYRAAVV